MRSILFFAALACGCSDHKNLPSEGSPATAGAHAAASQASNSLTPNPNPNPNPNPTATIQPNKPTGLVDFDGQNFSSSLSNSMDLLRAQEERLVEQYKRHDKYLDAEDQYITTKEKSIRRKSNQQLARELEGSLAPLAIVADCYKTYEPDRARLTVTLGGSRTYDGSWGSAIIHLQTSYSHGGGTLHNKVVSIGRFGEMRLGDVGSYRYAINMDANAARNVIEDREKRFLCFSVIRLKAARGTADNPYAMSFTSMIRGSREEQYLEINTSFLGTYLVDVHTNSVIGKWIPKTADQ